MKQIPLTIIAAIFCVNSAWASSLQDSTAYERQRERVNKLLNQRSNRFGEFDASLTARSGIFGLKTKKDMQASIDILKQIVLTDNTIFKETKALLNYKDFEKQTVEGQVEVSGERITGYINTISKLQRSQDQMAEEIMVLEKRSNIYLSLLLFAFLALIASLYILTKRKKN